MPDDNPRPILAAILGTDAVLAAQPVDAVQLTRACQGFGFDFVAPVSWGDELIASHLAARQANSGRASAISSSCPLISETLDAGPVSIPVLSTVSPPVACARYLRAAFRPRPVHVTYVGACHGAVHPEIDKRLLPDELFARLLEAGIDAHRQPRHFDAQIPAERARYASVPGGAPHAEWLLASAGIQLIEAAPITTEAVSRAHHDVPILIDLATSCRCACARDRAAAARAEPARSSSPVVGDFEVSVTDEPTPEGEPVPDVAGKTADRRATWAEYGLSEGEAAPLGPGEPGLTDTVEPW